MNDTFAKLNSKKESAIYRILSNKRLFDPITIPEDQQISYTSAHKLDEDCWFVIHDFSKRDYFPDMLKNNIISVDYNQLPERNFEKISFIFCVQGDDFYFQKITPKRIIRTAKFLEFGESVRIQEINNNFHLNKFPDAVYATDNEIRNFLDNSFIALSREYNFTLVRVNNRKLIAMAVDKIKDYSERKKNSLIQDINKNCGTLQFNETENSFEISNNGELKILLNGLLENYYTTAVSEEKRLANSTRVIN